MEPNKHVENARDNPYRSPIFRRVSEPHIVGKNLEHTGIVMEWWDGQKLCFAEVLHHCPPKEKGANYYHGAVFPADRLATAVEAMAFTVAEVDGKKYLPLDVLLLAIFQSGKANRPFMDVIREFPYPTQELSKWHPAPQRGNIIDQMEDEGFELYLCDAAVKAGGKYIQQIFWWAHPKSPVHAAEIAVSLEPKLNAEWVITTNEPSLVPEFTKDLSARFPDPLKIIRPAAVEQIRRLAETYRED
jgi:hypothetical protein